MYTCCSVLSLFETQASDVIRPPAGCWRQCSSPWILQCVCVSEYLVDGDDWSDQPASVKFVCCCCESFSCRLSTQAVVNIVLLFRSVKNNNSWSGPVTQHAGNSCPSSTTTTQHTVWLVLVTQPGRPSDSQSLTSSNHLRATHVWLIWSLIDH